MVGLALLTVLSLLWMARTGAQARTATDARPARSLRSLYAIVLGLGGWFLGVLIVLTTMPGVPLDGAAAGRPLRRRPDRARYLLRLGPPRLAGPDESVSASRRRQAGALVGAWLGLQRAAGDLLALVTTIVGAAAGANLTLILLDIAWDRQAWDRFAETGAKETLEAHPSLG